MEKRRIGNVMTSCSTSDILYWLVARWARRPLGISLTLGEEQGHSAKKLEHVFFREMDGRSLTEASTF
jgi:hypothetical protein